MFEKIYSKVKLRYFNREPEIFEVNYDDDIVYTDEIEKALWDIKESLDLPTKEVEMAIATRKVATKSNIK